MILGSTTEMERGRVVYQSYTVPGGKVKVEHGKVWHRDGTITDLDGNPIEPNNEGEGPPRRKLNRRKRRMNQIDDNKAAVGGFSPLICSPSYFASRRLKEASAAFLAAGVIVGCVASSFGPTLNMVVYGLAALWVMVAFWRITRLNDLENTEASRDEGGERL